MILQVLFLAFFLLPSSAVAVYYLSWALARIAGFRDLQQPPQQAEHRFMIVIPAHDEQRTLADTIQSCFRLDYPRQLYDVTVVADNCQDATSEIAQQTGAACLERTELERPGKGFALAWAFQRLQSTSHDAFLVLDADCTLDPQSLRVLDAFLQSGAHVLQANHRVTNPDATPISFAAAVGRRLEYDLFFSPKSRCGLAVLLVGTGMVLRRSVLQQFPWSSHSCTEDTEYTIRLAQQGLPVRFATDAWVECRAAETPEQLRVQRSRWARGNLALGKSEALRLIRTGLWRRDLLLADLGWTLLVLSRPLVLLHLVATQLAGAVLYWLDPSPVSRHLFSASLLLLAGYGFYLSLGVLALGLTRTRLGHLLRSPWVVVQLIAITLLSLGRSRHAPWTRTPRQ